MSKKPKPWQQPPATPAQVRARDDQAVKEGRFQQALELARELNKSQPTPAHRELLHNAYVGRARQQRGQGQMREAVVTLQADTQIPGYLPVWRESFIQEIGLCGDLHTILQLAVQQTEPAFKDKLLLYAADAAVQRKQAGRDALPEALRPDCDRVLTAFAQLEKGQDDACKETLQAIGLKSPFLEWKLLLRGLQAYYLKDDVRALENWQRLDATRFPYRLIAPLRFAIDTAFRQAQAPATQTVLQRQLDRFQSMPVAQDLQQVQVMLSRDGQFPQVLRKLEAMMPTLRAQVPHLVPKLAATTYQMLVTNGYPDDIPRYQRVFGFPPQDPSFHRIRAIGYERGEDLKAAHEYWQKYDKEIEANAKLFPGEQATRARALIWEHMGKNAQLIPEDKQAKKLPKFLRDHPSRPKPLKPGAEACYRRAIELAPDQLHTHRALFEFLTFTEETAKARKAGEELLKRFPDDQATLEEMAELLNEEGDHLKALECIQRAIRNNPLDRELQKHNGLTHAWAARSYAEKGQFDQARTHYQAALNHGQDPATIHCNWAACELKAKAPARAEELLTVARQTMLPTVLAYKMAIESARLKLPPAVKKPFEQEWLEGIKQPPDVEVGIGMAGIAASLAGSDITYTGQKTHHTKLKTYLGKISKLRMTEEQYLGLLRYGRELDMPRAMSQLVNSAQRFYPANPDFWLIPALLELENGPGSFVPWRVEQSLRIAEHKAQALPPGPKRDEILTIIHEAQERVNAMNPFRSLFGGFGDMFGNPFEDEWGDDDFEDDY